MANSKEALSQPQKKGDPSIQFKFNLDEKVKTTLDNIGIIPSIQFKFNLDEKVKTTLDNIGIIESLGFDGEGKKYWVKTGNSETDGWWKEHQIERV